LLYNQPAVTFQKTTTTTTTQKYGLLITFTSLMSNSVICKPKHVIST